VDLWPAIDILDGRCVRLRRGDFEDETRYGDPVEVAERFLEGGATRLHVVDLDAARTGTAANRDAILQIVRRTGLIVQAGGGVRSLESAAALLDNGVGRVVVGTAAVTGDPELLAELTDRWPNRIVVGLDYRTQRGEAGPRRELAVRGWVERSGVSLEMALTRLAFMPIAAVAVTDIDRDGTGAGPDLAGLRELLDETELPVIASGGIGSASDIARLSRLAEGGRGLAGVIVGKALLSGVLTIADAQRAVLGLTR
jgi:phosphoribosylformimino-5-aminoimidazole carboxamide ribotide isomerase